MDARERIIEQRMERRRRNALILRSLIAFLIALIVIFLVILIRFGIRSGLFDRGWKELVTTLTGAPEEISPEEPVPGTAVLEAENAASDAGSAQDQIEKTLEEASVYAAQYDYQRAIDLVKSRQEYNTSPKLQNFVASCQAQKDACAAWPLDQITHVFFHTLIRDNAKAFDGDENEAGYNQVMTTIPEFNSIIDQMYQKGYVMVSLHDMCEVHEDGSVSRKEIRLPDGKKALCLSQDDVSYYHYMKGDGFAEKLIVDENGEIKNTYLEEDGSRSVGDYDMVPLIDSFVKEHPDFAYHGHKGIIALTGYEGVLGYRTDEVYRTGRKSR